MGRLGWIEAGERYVQKIQSNISALLQKPHAIGDDAAATGTVGDIFATPQQTTYIKTGSNERVQRKSGNAHSRRTYGRDKYK